jgi:Short C-terminal domain/Phospholipase_D-nuclease N-terminal
MPLLDVFWTMLWFFCFFIWIMLLIRVFADIFRSHDLGGWGKAGWTFLVVFLPLLGVLVYLIARGGSMQKRQMQDAVEAKQQSDEYIRQAAASSSSTTELAKLAELHQAGTINDAEFEQAKSRILAA